MIKSETVANTVSILGLTFSVAQIETSLTILALVSAIILNIVSIIKKTKKE